MKKLLSFVLLIGLACTSFAACDGDPADNSSSAARPQKVDYAGDFKLNQNNNSAFIELTPTVEGEKKFTHIDGDTTHFQVPYSVDPEGTVKVRYMGVDTPESTGDIEEWGKAASNFTKSKISGASSVILESDADHWTHDTNGRYLAWVWYKPEGESDYRLLNLELLQEGLAVESRTENARYEDICTTAAIQARTLGLYIYSDDKDPDYYYGAAISTTLKEVCVNLEEYIGKRVAVHGIVSVYKGKGSIYVEDYVEDDGRAYGLPVFYGYNNPSYDPILAVGNEVRIVGEVTYSETFGYQICDLDYDFMDPNAPESIKCFSTGNSVVFPETTVAEFVKDGYSLAKSRLYSSISIKNLYVSDIYTTKDGDSKGAMTLTCEDANGTEIKIRTKVLRDADGNVITKDAFLYKTIDIKGIVEIFEGKYQIDVFATKYINVQN